MFLILQSRLKIHKVVSVIACVAMLAAIIPQLALAQLTPVTPTNADLVLTPSTRFPRPNQSVTISAESYAIDLNRSAIVWSVDGKQVAQGVGLTSYTVQTGGLGVTQTVRVLASEGGRRVSQTLFITPGEVELIWEAETYTRPLYKGKAPYTAQADLIVHALPNIKGYTASNMVFEWRKNGQVAARGNGLDTLRLDGDELLQSFILAVEVHTFDKKAQALASHTFTPALPEILLYRKSPVQGVLFNQALLNASTLNEDEFTISAFPHGFSTPNRFLSVSPLAWTINGTKNESTEPDLTFRKTGTGEASISVFGMTPSKVLQFARNQVTINLHE